MELLAENISHTVLTGCGLMPGFDLFFTYINFFNVSLAQLVSTEIKPPPFFAKNVTEHIGLDSVTLEQILKWSDSTSIRPKWISLNCSKYMYFKKSAYQYELIGYFNSAAHILFMLYSEFNSHELNELRFEAKMSHLLACIYAQKTQTIGPKFLHGQSKPLARAGQLAKLWHQLVQNSSPIHC